MVLCVDLNLDVVSEALSDVPETVIIVRNDFEALYDSFKPHNLSYFCRKGRIKRLGVGKYEIPRHELPRLFGNLMDLNIACVEFRKTKQQRKVGISLEELIEVRNTFDSKLVSAAKKMKNIVVRGKKAQKEYSTYAKQTKRKTDGLIYFISNAEKALVRVNEYLEVMKNPEEHLILDRFRSREKLYQELLSAIEITTNIGDQFEKEAKVRQETEAILSKIDMKVLTARYEIYRADLENVSNSWSGLIKKIVKSYIGRLHGSITFSELDSEGELGLIRAIENYDPNNQKFVTYAYRKINGAILSYIRSDTLVPEHLMQRHNKIDEVIQEFCIANARNPRPHEIAEITGLSEDQVKRAINIKACHQLEYLMEDEDTGKLDHWLVKDNSLPKYEEEDIEHLNLLLKKLYDGRGSRILKGNFGVECEEKSLRELGAEFGVGEGMACRIKMNALAELRRINDRLVG